uniref:7TM_GPCR_Srx domain-containing protein n=1 Tax=Rhabditophanes sp. KR3021 TaxID=114890 RepID=A0AC35TPF5_9BILA
MVILDVYIPTYDVTATAIDVVRGLPDSLQEPGSYIAIVTDYIVLLNPLVLFILYVLAFLSVKKLSNKTNKSSTAPISGFTKRIVPTVSSSFDETSNTVTQKPKFERILLWQGFTICIIYFLTVYSVYFFDPILQALGFGILTKYSLFVGVVQVLQSSVNAITFFVFNMTANKYFKKKMLCGKI